MKQRGFAAWRPNFRRTITDQSGRYQVLFLHHPLELKRSIRRVLAVHLICICRPQSRAVLEELVHDLVNVRAPGLAQLGAHVAPEHQFPQ